MGLILKGPWFIFAQMEIEGGASFALLKQGTKIWCASTSSTGTRFRDRCCHSPEGLTESMQRGPREREAQNLRFTIQRHGDFIYFPHLVAHEGLILDTGSPRILSVRTGRHHYIKATNCSTYSWNVGWVYFWCVSWWVARNFPKKCLSALPEWVFFPSTGLQESKDKVQKH